MATIMRICHHRHPIEITIATTDTTDSTMVPAVRGGVTGVREVGGGTWQRNWMRTRLVWTSAYPGVLFSRDCKLFKEVRRVEVGGDIRAGLIGVEGLAHYSSSDHQTEVSI